MRNLIAVFATSLAILLSTYPATAQTAGQVHRIGYLSTRSPEKLYFPAFLQGLRELGYVEGKNIVIESRYAHGSRDRLAELAAELVRLNVGVIVCPGSAARAAMKSTRTIPIVVTVAGDYVARGWAQSLRRPGGNVTGLSTLALDLMGKQLQLLKEVVPSLSRVAILHTPNHRGHAEQIRQAKEAAPIIGLGVIAITVDGAADLPAAFRRMKAEGIDGIVVLRSGFLLRLRGKITTYAREARLPSLFGHVREVTAGGLTSHGGFLSIYFPKDFPKEIPYQPIII